VRRIWRYLRNAATILSLLLCIAVVWQWNWSHRRSDMLRYAWPIDGGQRYRALSLWSVNGGIQLSHRTRDIAGRPFQPGFRAFTQNTIPFNAMNELVNQTDDGLILRLPGLQMRAERDAGGRRQFQLRLATAWLLAGTAVLPLVALYRLRYRSPTACPGCGYDIRATPERCPECGRTVEATTANVG
jgi:hypothetical protein